ncbi:MAG: protein-S-isoprenylcysteine O-methyltransferase [Chloroflexota bacterium]
MIFNLLYLLSIGVAIAIRVPYSRQYRKTTESRKDTTRFEGFSMLLWFIGAQILPIIYIFTGTFAFANYPRPVWLAVIGVAVLVAAMWLLRQSHVDLGKNWSAVIETRDEQELVTNGAYQHIRHPMYAAHWLWALAQAMLLANWLVGLAGLVTFLPLYLSRIPREEQMMLEQFGDDYRDYMQHTGRVIPGVDM